MRKTMERRRILVAVAQAIARKGLVAIIEQRRGWEVCAEFTAGRDVFRQAASLKPDVVLLDSALPDIDGLELARMLVKARYPLGIVVLLDEPSSEKAVRAFEAGAHSVALKGDAVEDLLAAIKAASCKESFVSPRIVAMNSASTLQMDEKTGEDSLRIRHLTPREREILQFLAEGWRPGRVARHLGISAKTVASHRLNLMGKLGLASAVELARFAIHHRIVPM